MENRMWQDWANVVFGIFLFISPGLFGFAGTAAAGNAYIVGIAVTVFALIALYRPRLWEEWVNLVLGVWLLIAPFVMVFAGDPSALWTHLIMGVLIAGDSLWAMQYRRPAAVR